MLCANLCTAYNGIFSATPHVSCVKFKNLYDLNLSDYFDKENRFEFGHILEEI